MSVELKRKIESVIHFAGLKSRLLIQLNSHEFIGKIM